MVSSTKTAQKGRAAHLFLEPSRTIQFFKIHWSQAILEKVTEMILYCRELHKITSPVTEGPAINLDLSGYKFFGIIVKVPLYKQSSTICERQDFFQAQW